MSEFERKGREVWEFAGFLAIFATLCGLLFGLPAWLVNQYFPGMPAKALLAVIGLAMVVYFGYLGWQFVYHFTAMLYAAIAPLVRWMRKRGG